MFPINWNDLFRKKDGTLGTMEDLGGGGSVLPEHSSSDAGKVLGVDNEGELQWEILPSGMKVYYKDVTYNTSSGFVSWQIAEGYYIYRITPQNTNGVDVAGYTPISCHVKMAFGSSVGFLQLVNIGAYGGDFGFVGIGNKSDISTLVESPIRVYYVKNTDIESIPT